MKKWIFLTFLVIAFIIAPLQSAFASARDDRAITVGGGRAYYLIYDENDMSTNNDYGLATQQSIKAYADGAGGVTKHICKSGVSQQATYDYNFWLVDTGTNVDVSGVTLPEITEDMDGFEITFKLMGNSGATKFPVSPTVNSLTQGDSIESTQGTYTASGDANLDAAGDLRTWKACWISGSTNIWHLILDER